MTSRRIDYFLTSSSPWTYLGHAELGRIAARHGATVACRPTPIRRLFDETGGLPLPKRHPVRQAYRLVDLQRWRAARDMPLDLDPAYPLADPSLSDKVALAIIETGGDPMPYLGAAMAGVWADRLDLSQPAVIAGLLESLGLDAEALLARADESAIAAIYEQNLVVAMRAGIFGAPSYVLDGEVFWGQDRLGLLDEALASGRPAYRPT